jgi:hypothetical protein
MGVTYSRLDERLTGGIQRERVVEAQFDASYTADGEPLTPADAGLSEIDNVSIESGTTDSGYVLEWTGSALVVREESDTGGGLTEVADGTDLSGESARLSIRGRS